MDIPIIILTSSTCQYDKEFAMKNNADFYMEKPLEIALFKKFLEENESKKNSMHDTKF